MPQHAYINAIEDVDREIEGGFRTLIFAPALEQRFENERRADRERYFIATGQLATVLYDLFLFSDWQMTPDVFWASCIVRLGIFTPLFGVVWYVFKQSPAMRVREGISCGLAIVSVILIMGVMVTSRAPDLASYQYGTVLIMLFTAMVQRLRFRYTMTALVGIFVVQITAILHWHDVSSQLTASAVGFYVTASILLASASYALERGERRGYLMELRSRFLTDHFDYIAKHDSLTGLWNRRHLDMVMGGVWGAASAACPRTVSVILLDIDHFKDFNDFNGHPEGDTCLRRVAACVAEACKSDDAITAVRFGGEEFLVFIDGSSPTAAKLMAERIQASIKKIGIPHPKLGEGGVVTASFGIATGQAAFQTIDGLVKAADEALYVAKRSGRDRIWPVVLRPDGAPQPLSIALPIAC